jgi:two-component system, sensor histidine kinase LadS
MHTIISKGISLAAGSERQGKCARHTLFTLLTCMILTVVAQCAWSNEAVILQSGFTNTTAPFCDVLEDHAGVLTIDNVSSPDYSGSFSPLRGHDLNAGLSSSVYWLRFSVRKEPDAGLPPEFHREWLLSINWPLLTSVTLYLPPGIVRNDQWIAVERQSAKTDMSNTLPPRLLLFRLPDNLYETRTFYLRVASETALFVPATIMHDNRYLDFTNKWKLCLGFFYGVFAVIMLVNFIQHLTLWRRSFLWHGLFTLSSGCYFLGLNGLLLEYVFPYEPLRVARISTIAGISMIFWACQFSRSYLDTKNKLFIPDRVIRIFMILAVAIVAISPFLTVRILTSCEAVLLFIVPVVLAVSGVLMFSRDFRSAAYYLAAWMLFLTGAAVFALTLTGKVPYSSMTVYGFQISTLVEVVFVQFALANRMSTLRREREEALHRERRYQLLSITDSLTGLYNVRYFRNQLPLEITRVESIGIPLSLLMLDIDDFKQYNDTQGHPAGDRLLGAFGLLILASIRDGDTACRYGGDEFAAILPGIDSQAAVDVAERIRRGLEQMEYNTGSKTGSVTVSVGIAQYQHGMDFNLLIDSADNALYQAKKQGKNRTVQSPVVGAEKTGTDPEC